MKQSVLAILALWFTAHHGGAADASSQFTWQQNPNHLAAASRVWNFIQQNLVDRVHGEWFWRINEDGQPDPKLPKVSEWKGPYHSGRACLEALRQLKAISAA